jgi:hypothetical protein
VAAARALYRGLQTEMMMHCDATRELAVGVFLLKRSDC